MKSIPETVASIAALLLAVACAPGSHPVSSGGAPPANPLPLPTGRSIGSIDITGPSIDVGNMPLAMAATPTPNRIAVLLSGYREQGLQVVDLESRKVVQTLSQTGAFLGLAFSPDGRILYCSGGQEDVVYRYAWNEGRASLIDRISLAAEPSKEPRYAAGLALSSDGRQLYVAENLADDLAVVDVTSGKVIRRLATGHFPYAVAVSPADAVYVSAWGGDAVSVFKRKEGGALADAGAIPVGRHPSALLLNPAGTRLFACLASVDRVAVVDLSGGRLMTTLADPPPSGPQEGSTPNALALSRDGTRLFVAEADDNSVAAFDLSAQTAGVSSAAGADRMAGRFPAEWYPVGLLADRDRVLVLNGKGRGSAPNPGGARLPQRSAPRDYTLGQLNGTVTSFPADPDAKELAELTGNVAKWNHWEARPLRSRSLPKFEHVVYIIKENRTYDQVFGDLPDGDGDPSLLYFRAGDAPNHRALARRFGLFDRFLCNAEVSSQGHPWSTSAYVTDYTEKTVQSCYSDRRPELEDEPDEPASGYLWDLARRSRITFRDYGEYAAPVTEPGRNVRYGSKLKGLAPFVNPDYPSFDLAIPDQRRADVWIAELGEFVRKGAMPALEVLHLPNDHTAGARPGRETPRAYMADNDLALGRIIEALSRSPFWKSTVVFVVEDDAQNGPDHVDSHRAPFLVISPYNRPGTIHRFVNTTDALATIEKILRLGSLSQFDHFGSPLDAIFSAEPDVSPYAAIVPQQPLTEKNPAQGKNARSSMKLDLDEPDIADAELFNRILWEGFKGPSAPYPGPRRLSALDRLRAD
jgi:YVTN family beta-propeller protein